MRFREPLEKAPASWYIGRSGGHDNDGVGGVFLEYMLQYFCLTDLEGFFSVFLEKVYRC
jgi:hypothetical protein